MTYLEHVVQELTQRPRHTIEAFFSGIYEGLDNMLKGGVGFKLQNGLTRSMWKLISIG